MSRADLIEVLDSFRSVGGSLRLLQIDRGVRNCMLRLLRDENTRMPTSPQIGRLWEPRTGMTRGGASESRKPPDQGAPHL
jgi:hypothetical protein